MDKLLELVHFQSWELWVAGAVICAILEITVPSFSFIFLSVAALIAALVALKWPLIAQVAAFALFTPAFILFTRPWILRRFQTRDKIPHRAGAMLGKTGRVTETVDPERASGRVMVQGEDWAAQSTERIADGTPIVVESSDGIVLKVKPI